MYSDYLTGIIIVFCLCQHVIIIVEVYTRDDFVINLGFWKTSEQEKHVIVDIKQIYNLKPTKKWNSNVHAIFPF